MLLIMRVASCCFCLQLSPAELLEIINQHFKKLQKATTSDDSANQEQDVHDIWGSLFQELHAAVARLHNIPCYPCFHVNDTSKMSYLKNPTAKVDFTFSSGSKVGIVSKTLLGSMHCVLLV